MNRLTCVGLAALIAFPLPAFANDYADVLNELAQDHLGALATDGDLLAAIIAQNAQHGGLTQADIDSLDQTWRAETGAATSPMIDTVLSNSASERLKSVKMEAEGLITEVFIMDNHGLNVGQSDVTSDYWQGDEAKFQETYGSGGMAVHISDVEFDESSQSYQSQVSLSIIDPASGAPVGAITFGIDIGYLE